MTIETVILQENFEDFFLWRSMLVENPPGFHFTWPFAAWLLSVHGTDIVTVAAVTSVKGSHGPPETYPTSMISVIWSFIAVSKRLSFTIPGLGRSPGERNGNPLHYSCLENPMDRGEPGGLQSMGLQRVRYDWVTHSPSVLHMIVSFHVILSIHLTLSSPLPMSILFRLAFD